MSSFIVCDLAFAARFLELADEGDRNVMVTGKAIRFACDAAKSLCICRGNGRQKWEVVRSGKSTAFPCNSAECRHID
jgi:hypothetical protein